MGALVLDFDGVISDSAAESFVTAGRTWMAMRPDSTLVGGLAVVREALVPDPDHVAGETLFREFRSLMPLGNRAEDFAVALAALERGKDLPDQAAYDSFRMELDQKWLLGFHRRFYQERALVRERDLQGWLRLQQPFPNVVSAMWRHHLRVPMAIATAKDRGSVHALLTAYGLQGVFPDERIADKETGVSKQAHMLALRGPLGVDCQQMTFVDDKVNHLDAVAVLGVRGVLAAWGFNGERDRVLARSRGYRVMGLDDVDELFHEGR